MGKKTTTKVSENNMGNACEQVIDGLKRLCDNAIDAAKQNGPDSGQNIPVQPNLVWFFRRMCQVVYETLDLQGRVSNQNGRRVYSLRETLEFREKQFSDLQSKHTGNDEALVTDPQYDTVARNLNSAIENFSVFLLLDSIAKEMFSYVTHGEEFKPWVAPTNTVMKAAIDAATAEKRKAELAALRAKSA